MSNIHPSSVVDPKAQLADTVTVGPFCIIGPDVVLGDNVELISHVVIEGRTTVGANNKFFPFSSIGHCPQDLKYNGEPSRLEIGNNNIIREHVTLNPGTEGGGMLTKIGNDCLIMVGTHVGHDCQIGNNVILVNNATLAGHVIVEDWAIIGGLSAVHQFCRIGRHAMIGGMSAVENDVIPYGSVTGNRARLAGLNIVGLKRRNFDREIIHSMRTAYRLLFAQEGTMAERVEDVSAMFNECEPVMEILKFIRQDSSRGVCTPK